MQQVRKVIPLRQLHLQHYDGNDNDKHAVIKDTQAVLIVVPQILSAVNIPGSEVV